MIKIGCYKLNIEDMVLSRDGNDVIIEPKVLSVLIYFCENKDRYISMTELHENVWKDRCVSDAAVRRIISKIRLLFNDDHKSPKYIQSLPKRGYKLICSVSYEPCSKAIEYEHLSENNLIQKNKISEEIAPEIEDSVIAFFLRKKVICCFSILIIFFSIALIKKLSIFTKSNIAENLISTKVIHTFPGDKRAVAQSENGKYLAFSGQINEDSGYQVYIQNRDKPGFKSITHQAHLPNSLAFSKSNDVLFFSDSLSGSSSLNMVNVTKNNAEIEVILSDYYLIYDVFTSDDLGVVYFSGQKAQTEPILIYKHDLLNDQTIAITASSQVNYLDVKGSISTSGELLVVLRYLEFENINEVRVINLKTNDVIFRRQYEQVIYDLDWLDENNLIILNDTELLKVNYKTLVESKVIEGNHDLAYIDVIDNNTILSVQEGRTEKIFIEKSLPFSSFNIINIFKENKNIHYMDFYPNEKDKLVLLNNDGITQLSKLNHTTNDITTYIETEDDLDLLELYNEGKSLLVKVNKRFAILNTEKSKLDYISTGDDTIGDATFSQNGHSILYSVKSYGRWIINIYNIEMRTVTPLIKGFRYIRTFGNKYILGSSNGELFYYDSEVKKLTPLNDSLSTEPNTSWYVRGNYIYWSSHDLVNTVFHQFDISDITKPIKLSRNFSFNKMRPWFTMAPDGKSLLLFQIGGGHSEVVRLSIE